MRQILKALSIFILFFLLTASLKVFAYDEDYPVTRPDAVIQKPNEVALVNIPKARSQSFDNFIHLLYAAKNTITIMNTSFGVVAATYYSLAADTIKVYKQGTEVIVDTVNVGIDKKKTQSASFIYTFWGN